MLRSMTGFGHQRRLIHGADYTVEIRSVNGRYYKSSIRLPEIWAHIEPEADQRLRRRLGRGSIQMTLRMKAEVADVAYEINTAVLERYIEQLDALRPEQTDVRLSIDLANLLQVPGVCNPPEPEEFCRKSQPELMQLIDQTIGEVVAMRTEEGKGIAADLLAQCGAIQQSLQGVSSRAPLVVREYHERLKRRVEELLAAAQLKLDEQDLAREVAVFAERCDISEELSRLAGHLAQFAAGVEKEDQPGRKLDFIAQEMLREANTIGSKSNDGEIARAVVEIKTAVDRIKEQVQNVE